MRLAVSASMPRDILVGAAWQRYLNIKVELTVIKFKTPTSTLGLDTRANVYLANYNEKGELNTQWTVRREVAGIPIVIRAWRKKTKIGPGLTVRLRRAA